jgi:hypothetical protein
MNKQEIFDTVVKHLANQQVASRKNALQDGNLMMVCAYRGDNGTKCAVGCLIKDEDYHTSMEAIPVDRLASEDSLPVYLLEHVALLEALQLAHDTAWDRRDITAMLKDTASLYQLDDSSVDLITQWS